MKKGVTFTLETAERIGAAVRKVEGSGLDRPGRVSRAAGGDDGGEPVRLGKTTAQWAKGTTAMIDLYETGTANAETKSGTLSDCVNKFATVAAGKWVIVARGPLNAWYLISAECG